MMQKSTNDVQFDPVRGREGLQRPTSNGIDEMFKAGMHFGYSRQSRNPKIKPYLYGSKDDVGIFDLEKTKSAFQKAEDFISGLGQEGKTVLFVGTKPEAKDLVWEAAQRLGMPACTERWLGGTLTNLKIIKGRLDYFENLKKDKESGELKKYKKKERLEKEKELERLERFFGGLLLGVGLRSLPSALIVVDSNEESIAVEEASKVKIPAVALLNSDCDPTSIDYPIVGNDASMLSIKYFLDRIVNAYGKLRKS
jgi:small subunit ribosomal protein S2